MRTLSLAPISGRRRSVAGQTLLWAAPSVLAHSLVIAALALPFAPAVTDRPFNEVIFLAPLLPRQDAQQPADAATGPGGSPLGWTDLTSIATGAGIGLGTAIGSGIGRGEGNVTGPIVTSDSVSAPAAGDEHVYQAVDVDREVTRESDAVAPVYPEELRIAGVQGAVTVEFVVDTTGRVQNGSFHIIGTTHASFATAVRSAASGMHFRPAVRGGQLVRQQVIQSFQFVLQTAVQSASTSRARADSSPP
jgi:TonB family protein